MSNSISEHIRKRILLIMCLAGAVAIVADMGRCNPKVPSSIPAAGKDFP